MIISSSPTASAPLQLSPAQASAGKTEKQQASASEPENTDNKASDNQSNQAQRSKIAELAKRDREVRAHEQAHVAVGGAYTGAASFTYERGPNGRLYATGGEVSIDTSTVPNDPQATLQKATIVQRAALAPAQPSDTDRRVAAEAAAIAAQARIEIATQRTSDPTSEPNQQGSLIDVKV